MRVSLFAIFSIMMMATPALGEAALIVGDKNRTYRVHVPKRIVPEPPLLIALHPRPANGAAMAHISSFNAIADREGFIIAYPDGIDGAWDVSGDCRSNNDVQFVDQLIAKLARDHSIDPGRVYLAGVSNGGRMAFRLLEEMPGTFAAVAAVSGFPKHDDAIIPTFPNGPSATPLIAFMGNRDKDHPAHWLALARWKIRFGCRTISADLPYPSTMRMRSLCGSPDSPLIEYHFNDTGHVWPGATESGPLSWPDAPFQASERIFEFFNAQRLKPSKATGDQAGACR